jgi:hypothetical protein
MEPPEEEEKAASYDLVEIKAILEGDAPAFDPNGTLEKIRMTSNDAVLFSDLSGACGGSGSAFVRGGTAFFGERTTQFVPEHTTSFGFKYDPPSTSLGGQVESLARSYPSLSFPRGSRVTLNEDDKAAMRGDPDPSPAPSRYTVDRACGIQPRSTRPSAPVWSFTGRAPAPLHEEDDRSFIGATSSFSESASHRFSSQSDSGHSSRARAPAFGFSRETRNAPSASEREACATPGPGAYHRPGEFGGRKWNGAKNTRRLLKTRADAKASTSATLHAHHWERTLQSAEAYLKNPSTRNRLSINEKYHGLQHTGDSMEWVEYVHKQAEQRQQAIKKKRR